ncbi:MAG: hypothetical protein AAF197_02400 [Pseudomonadota bacterium]
MHRNSSPQSLAFVGVFRSWRIGILLLGGLSSGCATYEYHEAKRVDVSKSVISEQSPELLLDVGIRLFDSGIDLIEDASIEYESVRASEAVWFSQQLKTTLETSRAWGLVRILPDSNAETDLNIEGQLIESNGETVVIKIKATDSLDQIWLDKEYAYRASQYSYNPEIQFKGDPFQPLITEVANNLFDVLATKSNTELTKVRQVGKLKFAEFFLPELVDDYMRREGDEIVLIGAPAENDPMMARIDRIQARNQMFLDVVQDYYRAFNKNMESPYAEWRKLGYREVVYERQLRQQAKQERIAGIALMAAGVVASRGSGTSNTIGRYLSLVSGGWLFARSYGKDNEASIHGETLRELGVSLENELAPSVVDLQERTVTLSGTVEEQFESWRDILQQMFVNEFPEAVIEADLEQPVTSGI